MSLSDVDFDFVRRLVRQHSAIQLEDSKSYLAEARLERLARLEGIKSSRELIDRVRNEGSKDLQQRVVQAMTTNETLFFRDNHPYEVLKSQIIPDLIKTNAASKRLTIWSAACSTGQEPYSIAMLIHRNFPQLSDWEVRIIASDLSQEVLERAMRGRFNQLEVNRGLSVEYLLRYFDRHGLEWQIKDEIRSMITFAQMNLIANWPPLPIVDIVFLRNVMIYFDLDTKRTILARMSRVVRTGGYLVLGASESTMSMQTQFDPIPGATGFYRNHRDPAAILPLPHTPTRPNGQFRVDRGHGTH